jgi:hypothetical protein
MMTLVILGGVFGAALVVARVARRNRDAALPSGVAAVAYTGRSRISKEPTQLGVGRKVRP